MSDLEFHDSEIGLKDLFAFAYTTNCNLDGQSLTDEDKSTLTELDSLEVLENFKDLVLDLLNCKKDFKHTEQSELAKRSEQFEVMLQKLESEVRGHIRVEQQLKLHLESAQATVDEFEKMSDGKAVQQLKASLAAKEKEIEDLKRRSPGPSDDSIEGKLRKIHYRGHSLEEKLKKGSSKIPKLPESKDRAVQKLEIQCEQLKNLLRDKQTELDALRREYQSLAHDFMSYKERMKARTVLGTYHKDELSDISLKEESMVRRTDTASPYKEKSDPVYIRTVYQTYISSDPSKSGKRHVRTSSDRTWRPSSSSRRSRPVSSLKV